MAFDITRNCPVWTLSGGHCLLGKIGKSAENNMKMEITGTSGSSTLHVLMLLVIYCVFVVCMANVQPSVELEDTQCCASL